MAGKRKRGPTHNEKVRARDAAERHIKFKQDGTPTGPSKSEFANTVAYLVRDWVSCSIKSWELVAEELKLALWEEVQVNQMPYTKKIILYIHIYTMMILFWFLKEILE
jgi:hypothetical protein